jgi:hypothetical protein
MMQIDTKAIGELLEQSQDLHSDSMRSTEHALKEVVELGQEQRARGVTHGELAEDWTGTVASGSGVLSEGAISTGGTLAAAALGGALLMLTASPAFASVPDDVQMLQTSAALENLAVSTYKTALSLPYIGGSSANPVIQAFAQTTMSQHAQHAQAFNSAAEALGGKAQNAPDPRYLPVVNSAVASISKDDPSAGALAVVELAITLENVAAETYVNNCSKFKDSNAKRISASIMGVEAQHVAVLSAVKALLAADAPQLIALSPTVVASLPSAAGSVGFPNSFYPTNMASPANEGALS